jgi:hypothetical protein
MKGRRQVKEGFSSLETFDTWIVYVCHSEGEWARQEIEVSLNRARYWVPGTTVCVMNWGGATLY